MSKVKFNVKNEYEYIANYKVLQGIFDKHKIDNAIPVERLVKCKFQDNIEFLLWMKKYINLFHRLCSLTNVQNLKKKILGSILSWRSL